MASQTPNGISSLRTLAMQKNVFDRTLQELEVQDKLDEAIAFIWKTFQENPNIFASDLDNEIHGFVAIVATYNAQGNAQIENRQKAIRHLIQSLLSSSKQLICKNLIQASHAIDKMIKKA